MLLTIACLLLKTACLLLTTPCLLLKIACSLTLAVNTASSGNSSCRPASAAYLSAQVRTMLLLPMLLPPAVE